jgi:hypothetical protein
MATAAVQDEMVWKGAGDGGPVWPTRAEPGAVYEYSVKRISKEGHLAFIAGPVDSWTDENSIVTPKRSGSGNCD